MHDLLVPLVDRVIVCDRRGKSRRGNKGDQVDADELSELLRRGALRSVYHGSPDRPTLKELTRTYQNVVEDSTRVMQRLKALFRARGIKAPGKRVYHPTNRSEWHPVLRTGARRPSPGHPAHTLAVPHQAAAVGVLRTGRRDLLQRRLHPGGRATSPAPARTHDPRAQPQSQPGAEGHLQGGGHGRHRTTRPAP